MSSFVFNTFKQRFLNGQVPSADTWNFTPMNKNFTKFFGKDEYPIEQFRTLGDFYDHNADKIDKSYLSAVITDYEWYKPTDTDEINKPMFITSGVFDEKGKAIKQSNWEKFKGSYYYPDVTGNSAIPYYLTSGGFYYIRTKAELRWFANRANSGNNRIIGVIGDGIDGVIRGQIGENESYPFEGILDGNGHSLDNLQVICDNTDNGVVGVLGRDGTVRNFKLENTQKVTNLVCKKRINLQHIKDDGRDINAAILVGRNYGTIENINARSLNMFKFSGFVPEVYTVSNKSDNYSDFSTIREKFDQGENFYHLNSFCINSPGNICPYVGYFAEGLFAQKANVGCNCIEAQPARKSKQMTGLINAEFDLKNSSFKVAALYVKDNASTGSGRRKSGKDGWIWSTDDIYGRNAVMIIAVDVKDSNNVDRRIWLEVNGMAYDKKAGTGKRRYHFFPGHIGSDSLEINAESIFTGSIAGSAHFQGVTSSSWFPDGVYRSRGGGDSVDDDWMGPADSKGVFENGWRAAVYKKTYTRTATTEWPAEATEKITSIPLYFNLFYGWSNGEMGEDGGDATEYVCEPDDIEVFADDGTPGSIISFNMDEFHWQPRNKKTSSSVWDSAPVKLWLQQINTITYYDYDEKTTKTWGSAGTFIRWTTGAAFETNILSEMPFWCAYAIRDSLSSYFAFRYDYTSEPKINNSYNGELIIDSEYQAELARYFMKRESRWFKRPDIRQGDQYYSMPAWIKWLYPEFWGKPTPEKTDWVFDWMTYKDITVNGDSAKDHISESNTVEATIINLAEFQYRPFVHGFADCSDPGRNQTDVNPGMKFSDVSARFGSSATAINYFVAAAKQYAQNPNYYGMDFEGRWTSQAVREDDYLEDMGDGDSEINYLNFNWNIMRKQWEDWEDVYGRYDNASDDNESDDLYGDVDIPHALYNRPIRMHEMGRAAYYISPIAGSNYGTISNVIVSSTRQNDGNFVGFIGSIAGKQERGKVLFSHVYAIDKFNYYEDKPAKPDSAAFTTMDPKIGDWHVSYRQACDAWSAATAAYNYEVRYKTTPIIPEALAGDTSVLVNDPDDNAEEYEYYPKPDDTMDYDDVILGRLTYYNTANNDTTRTGYFVDPRDNKTYTAIKVSSWKLNPNYLRDMEFANAGSVIKAYTSAWYNDYDATATNVMDDTLTFKLKPIFNAGGLFGKYVPNYNYSVISHDYSADSAASSISHYTHGTLCQNVDVHYILSGDNTMKNLKAVHGGNNAMNHVTNDIHNSFGAIAGSIDLQTSQLGQFQRGTDTALILNNLNVAGETNMGIDPVLPFGIINYKPSEINTVQATEGAGRGKGRCWHGIRQNTSFAIDYPIMSNRGNKFEGSTDRMCYAPINQSSAAFFNFRTEEWKAMGDGHMTTDGKRAYYQSMLDTLVSAKNTNINTKKDLAYCSIGALDIYAGRRGPQSLNAAFGSNTTFTASMKKDSTSANFETLTGTCITREYEIVHDALTANHEYTTAVNYNPHNIDCLKDTQIFNRPEIDDLYFNYSYTTSTSYSDDLTFSQNVMFTSAARDNVKTTMTPSALHKNINLGYVFKDNANWEADGFTYRYNNLRLGESVSPNRIRSLLKTYDKFNTSSVSAVQWGKTNGELDEEQNPIYEDTDNMYSASENNQFGGILVTDSNERCVMWLENENGTKLEGNPWAVELPHVKYGNNEGGLVLAIKGSNA